MTDISQLKMLANMLRPLAEIIPVLERVEASDQSIRSAEARLAVLSKEAAAAAAEITVSRKKAADILAEANRKRDKIEVDVRQLMDETEARCSARRAKSDEDVALAKKTVVVLVEEAKAKVAAIEKSVADKQEECAKLDKKIATMRDKIRKLIDSAD